MIKQIAQNTKLQKNYALKNCTSFGIGGPAKYFASPSTNDELFNLLYYASKNNLSYKIIGNGTNILFADHGFDGLIISTKKLNTVEIVGKQLILASAGASLASVIAKAKENSLTGLEFAVGIPGTVGGAIVMNAGAGGGDISLVTRSVTVIEQGCIKTLFKDELNFAYRSSYFTTHKNSVILFAELELQKGIKREIEEKMQINLNKRLSSQPKEKSAGCVFKKCGEVPAGLLIDNAGLKNLRIGDARVSEIHANFIVNDGNASAQDVKKLIQDVKRAVWNKYKLNLQLEIEIIE